jgi:tetratricopeptide (TPR) repeat protein
LAERNPGEIIKDNWGCTVKPLVFALLAVVVLGAGVACADDADDCSQSVDRDLSIRGCTASIEAGGQTYQDLAFACRNRGNAYGDKGQTDRAIADYGRGLEIESAYFEVYSNSRHAFEALGKTDNATRD